MALVVGKYEALFTLRSHISLGFLEKYDFLSSTLLLDISAIW
jgi:hypothetical protein